MKSIIFLVLALSVASVSGAQAITDWKQMELKGKVKSLETQETYRYKKNGVAFTAWEKTYKRNYLFNNTGRRTEFQETKNDGTAGYRIVYTNNLKDKKIELAYFDKYGKPTIKKIHTLDDKGRMIEELEYTREGKPDRRYVYTNDDKGNMMTMTGYKVDGTMSSKTTWTYNDKGKVTDWLLETPGYANGYKKYMYDEKGNQKEESWLDGNKQVTFRFVRYFDDKGNKIEELKYKNGNQLLDMSKWRYEYDKAGNWIKRTQATSDGDDFHIEERTIVYY